MNNKGGWALVLSIVVAVIILIGMFFYFSLFKPSGKELVNLANPAENLSLAEVQQQFNGDFVYYLLASIKAYNLHNPPLSKDYPKIEILVGDKAYYASVRDSQIMVLNEPLENVDVKIVTSLEEAAKMVKYPGEVKNSFERGDSQIELLASKTLLFSKGYLNMYSEITGKSITGNVIKIYTS